ncbi:MAG: nucleotidyl transferase AbiEii/AbiGii toxin family protein [Myxococcota bacterium]|jgi:predicted nucleotidyltransferase component of viral defense system
MRSLEPFVIEDIHEDNVLFREAIDFTSAKTGFLPRLIEKDYFCTLLLTHLVTPDCSVVFKGGTCLAKVYAGFYRLSEDLDFAIPTPVSSTRPERRLLSEGFKRAVQQIGAKPGIFRTVEPLAGANASTQYLITVGYLSVLNQREETIKIEVGLREPLLTPVFHGEARTILLNPISGKPMVPGLDAPCISMEEAMAEKLRAALSRREAAIRDFYDIDYAVRRLDFKPFEASLLELVRQKVAVPGNEPVDVSGGRLAALKLQVDSRLKPVLRKNDFSDFSLERAFGIVAEVAGSIKIQHTEYL